jgi:hypothetical protein
MPNESLDLNLLIPQKPIRRTVALPPDFWEAAKQLGEGNTTLGLKRALVAQYKAGGWKVSSNS